MRRTSTLPFVAALMAVMVSFLISTIYSQSEASRIHELALSIATKSSPSVQHLTSARAESHVLVLQLSDAIDAVTRHDPYDPKKTRAQIDKIHNELQDYESLTAYLGELPFQGKLKEATDRLDDAALAVDAELVKGNAPKAQRVLDDRLRAAAESFRSNTVALVDFNAEQASRLAYTIERQRAKANITAFALDGMSLCFGVLVLFLSARANRRYAQLVTEHSQLVERRADELEQFAGRMAHDVLSPLGPVGLFLGLIKHSLDGDARMKTSLQRAENGLARAKRLVSDLLDFARAGAKAAPNARTDVGSVLEDLRDGLEQEAEAAHINLRFPHPAHLAVACTPGVLTSLIQNLVRNAIKYMGDQPTREIEVRVIARSETIRFEVQDTGPGLTAGIEDSIFQPYVRAPGATEPGIGLGLATVKRLTDSHGGDVGVKSAPGRGCLFWFELPRAHAPLADKAAEPSQLRH